MQDPAIVVVVRTALYTYHSRTIRQSINSIRSLFLLFGPVLGNHHGVISLVRFQRELLERFKVFRLQFAHFASKDGFRGRRAVNAGGLDGNDGVAAIFQKVVRIQCHNAGLIGLGDIGKDGVDHAEQHAVLERVSGVFDNGNNVGALLGDAEQVASGAVGEFDRVDRARGTDNVAHVRDRGARSGAQIEHLGAGVNVNVVDTTENGSGDCS